MVCVCVWGGDTFWRNLFFKVPLYRIIKQMLYLRIYKHFIFLGNLFFKKQVGPKTIIKDCELSPIKVNMTLIFTYTHTLELGIYLSSCRPFPCSFPSQAPLNYRAICCIIHSILNLPCFLMTLLIGDNLRCSVVSSCGMSSSFQAVKEVWNNQ